MNPYQMGDKVTLESNGKYPKCSVVIWINGNEIALSKARSWQYSSDDPGINLISRKQKRRSAP